MTAASVLLLAVLDCINPSAIVVTLYLLSTAGPRVLAQVGVCVATILVTYRLLGVVRMLAVGSVAIRGCGPRWPAGLHPAEGPMRAWARCSCSTTWCSCCRRCPAVWASGVAAEPVAILASPERCDDRPRHAVVRCTHPARRPARRHGPGAREYDARHRRKSAHMSHAADAARHEREANRGRRLKSDRRNVRAADGARVSREDPGRVVRGVPRTHRLHALSRDQPGSGGTPRCRVPSDTHSRWRQGSR